MDRLTSNWLIQRSLSLQKPEWLPPLQEYAQKIL